jgi:hypothetical protein
MTDLYSLYRFVVLYLQRELAAAQELRDQQIAELQRQTEENALCKQTVLDKKVVIFWSVFGILLLYLRLSIDLVRFKGMRLS